MSTEKPITIDEANKRYPGAIAQLNATQPNDKYTFFTDQNPGEQERLYYALPREGWTEEGVWLTDMHEWSNYDL